MLNLQALSFRFITYEPYCDEIDSSFMTDPTYWKNLKILFSVI